MNPSLIGDGVCQNVDPYYTERCGWDERDCSTIVSVWIILIGVAYIVLPLFVLENRRRRRFVEEALRRQQVTTNDESIRMLRERRRELVLKNIIHKVRPNLRLEIYP